MSCYYVYNFPPIEVENDKAKQIRKILEEATEVANAEDDSSLVGETLDTVQACETLLRMFDESFVREVKQKTITKNAERGYYGKKGTWL